MKLKKYLYPTLSVLFWLLLWHLIAILFKKPLLLPTPKATLAALFRLAKTAPFWGAVATSLSRILLGIVLALVSGALLALATTHSRFCHHLFSPLLALFKATPVASIIFLLLLWVGRPSVPLLIAFMMALPIVWANLCEGLSATDQTLLEMARVFRFSFFKRLKYIHIPSLLPFFLSACRTAISLAWKAGIAAEVLCVPEHSIGRAIYEGNLYLLTDDMFAWTLTVILLSILIEQGALALVRLARKSQKKKEARDDLS